MSADARLRSSIAGARLSGVVYHTGVGGDLATTAKPGRLPKQPNLALPC
jgi:hypothetical protein